MLDDRRYVCLINDVLADEKKQFTHVKPDLDKQQAQKETVNNEEKRFQNEYDSVLLENLVI